MSVEGLIEGKQGFVGPTFGVAHRARRAAWCLVWMLGARWTPPPLHRWRILLLRLFGARVSWEAYVYPSVDIWAPWNLTMEKYATLARRVTCYNMAPVVMGSRAVVSQGAHLCTGSHAYRDPAFPLIARPIHLGRRSWVCADAFVGPGVTVGDGAILAGAGVAFADLKAWTVYAGNPATVLRRRPVIAE